jgi:hypothetical protein
MIKNTYYEYTEFSENTSLLEENYSLIDEVEGKEKYRDKDHSLEKIIPEVNQVFCPEIPSDKHAQSECNSVRNSIDS